MLEQGCPAPHSCKTGVCRECKASLFDGEVSSVSSAALTEKEVNEGFILCCQRRSAIERAQAQVLAIDTVKDSSAIQVSLCLTMT